MLIIILETVVVSEVPQWWILNIFFLFLCEIVIKYDQVFEIYLLQHGIAFQYNINYELSN